MTFPISTTWGQWSRAVIEEADLVSVGTGGVQVGRRSGDELGAGVRKEFLVGGVHPPHHLHHLLIVPAGAKAGVSQTQTLLQESYVQLFPRHLAVKLSAVIHSFSCRKSFLVCRLVIRRRQWRYGEAHFSRRVFMTFSSSSRCAAGHSARTMAVSAYICSFFFRICSYCALRWWYCFTLHTDQLALTGMPIRQLLLLSIMVSHKGRISMAHNKPDIFLRLHECNCRCRHWQVKGCHRNSRRLTWQCS